MAEAFFAQAAPSAGGAPLDQLAVLAAVYWGGSAAVIATCARYRRGKARPLRVAGRVVGRLFGLPGWSALPVAIATVGLLAAMWGGMWDIGYHIDQGRDTGPLGNPAHYPMLFGIFAAFAAGVLALGTADQRDRGPAWVPAGGGRRGPLGGALLAAAMLFALAALSLDDVWHRIYGQDVTLWSPTHFVFLFFGVLSVVGMLVLVQEGAEARAKRASAGVAGRDESRAVAPTLAGARRWARWFGAAQRATLLGGLLCGLELFLAEYDYGVPLYRQVWQPLVLALAAAFVLVAARAWVGRGAALGAATAYVAVRGSASLFAGAMGVHTPTLPLFFAEALAVEVVGSLLLSRRAVPAPTRTVGFGAVAGVVSAAADFAAGYGWSRVAMPLPWTTALLPEGLLLALLGGCAGGVLGALFAASLRGALPRPALARAAFAGAAALAVGACVAASLRTVPDAVARVELRPVAGSSGEAYVVARLSPAAIAAQPNWLYVLAWQGRRDRVVAPMARAADGSYRSTSQVPLAGTWKAALRLNAGRVRGAVPLRLPADAGLDGSRRSLPVSFTRSQLERAMRDAAGAALPAAPVFTRAFVGDEWIFLREARGVPPWLWQAGLATVLGTWAAMALALALGLGRLGRRFEARGGMSNGARPAGRGQLRHVAAQAT